MNAKLTSRIGERNVFPMFTNGVRANPASQDRATDAPHEARSGLRHSVGIGFRGPSERFLNLTRNTALASPARFEPTVKQEGDVVL